MGVLLYCYKNLTPELGHLKPREHMSSVITMMKLSKDYDDFIQKLNQIHPQYNETLSITFDDDIEGL